MKTFLEFLLVCFLRTSLWFRYRIKVEGYDKLNPKNLNKPGGILFLPNHPTVFVDATVAMLAIWPKFRARPLVIEYMYQSFYWVMRLIDALPVPNFYTSNNSLKRKKTEKVMQTIVTELHEGKNFMIFPSGRVKHSAYEAIDGASAVHRIVQEAPQANVVLIRIKGLWGSSFSRALTGQNPPIVKTFLHGIGIVLKNLIFFTPRREIIIELLPAPADFPYHANRLEFNKYLEQFYNKPDGLRPQTQPYPGDSLVLVSFSMWKDEFPTVWSQNTHSEDQIDYSAIPQKVKTQVMAKLAELTSRDPSSISPEMNLTSDLGLDSLDISELTAFLSDQFDINGVGVEDLTTVGKLLGIAGKQIVSENDEDEEEEQDLTDWKKPIEHKKVQLAPGDTMPEVFLNSCARMGSKMACGDMRAGAMTYSQLKLRALILAQYIRRQPGEYIGIMLPASVAATLTVFACQIAGKIPLMVNWTVGPRHLQAVMEQSKVKVVLSSWAFIEKLQHVELAEMDDLLVMLEDVRRELSISAKMKALLLSKLSTKAILKAFKIDRVTKDDKAVLLFTSGTESMPKGVPLSHNNILSNQRAGLDCFEMYTDDVVFGILPPFHSFGFTVSGSTALLAGARVAYSPDPTNGKQLATAFEKWGVTIMCGAPTFIKGLLKAATPEQLKTMRICITGAEKAPQELYDSLQKIGKRETMVEGYGITECSPILTVNINADPKKGVGKPLPCIELLIVDLNTHEKVPVGHQGLILARGPNIFNGYITPGLASPFIQIAGKEWYVTGDLGSLDAEGNLTISGRLKRFIKVGGEMVSLTSIEDALSNAARSKGFTQTEEGPILVICAKELPGDKPKISLYCKFPATIDEVNKSLKDAGFSNLVRVTSVTQLAEIPIMGTGKTNYRALESMNNG